RDRIELCIDVRRPSGKTDRGRTADAASQYAGRELRKARSIVVGEDRTAEPAHRYRASFERRERQRAGDVEMILASLHRSVFQVDRFDLDPSPGDRSGSDIGRGLVVRAGTGQFRSNSYRRYIESFGNYSIRIDSALEVIIASGAVQFSGQH